MQDAAERTLERLRRSPATTWTIHYACESWYDVKDRPVEVSTISVVRCSDRSQLTFSQTDHKEDAERKVLTEFYSHCRDNPDIVWVHWNMHSSDFGFDALRKRYKYVFEGEPPYAPSEANIVDLDQLIGDLYGRDFAPHPKLQHAGDLNGYTRRYFLPGADEAKQFAAGQHGTIKRSTAEKAQLVAYLLNRVQCGTLVTATSSSMVEFAAKRLSCIAVVEHLADRFEYVRRQLTRRHDGRPTLEIKDEHDFQDLFRSLLQVFFDDVRPEEYAPSYAGGSSRIDFVLPTARLAIELKHAGASMTARQLGEELIVDRARYQGHGSVDVLVCLVFDREGRISNPRGVEQDLAKADGGVPCVVRIIDR